MNDLEVICPVCGEAYENEVFYRQNDKCPKDEKTIARIGKLRADVRYYQQQLQSERGFNQKARDDFQAEIRSLRQLVSRQVTKIELLENELAAVRFVNSKD